jgi:hypothetical protein
MTSITIACLQGRLTEFSILKSIVFFEVPLYPHISDTSQILPSSHPFNPPPFAVEQRNLLTFFVEGEVSNLSPLPSESDPIVVLPLSQGKRKKTLIHRPSPYLEEPDVNELMFDDTIVSLPQKRK